MKRKNQTKLNWGQGIRRVRLTIVPHPESIEFEKIRLGKKFKVVGQAFDKKGNFIEEMDYGGCMNKKEAQEYMNQIYKSHFAN